MEAILALERDVELAANARLDEVLLRLHLYRPRLRPERCEKHNLLAQRLAGLGIQIGRLKRHLDRDDWLTPQEIAERLPAQIEELALRKKALSHEFHATPCTCQEM